MWGLDSVKDVVRRGRNAGAWLRDRVLKTSRMSLERPVFIWGAPRSGTHLLYDILSLHPCLMCPRTDRRSKKGLWGDMHWGDGTPEALRGRQAPYEGLQRCWLDAGIGYDSVGVFDRERLTPAMAATVRQRYRDLGREWRWRDGGPYRVLDKSPTYLLMVDAIEAVFPDAHHVFCIRDPRAILNSLLRIHRFPEQGKGAGQIEELGFATGVPPGHEAHRNESVVRRLTWQVRVLHELGLAHRERLGTRLVEFRYESLLEASHASAEALFAPLALPQWGGLRALVPSVFPDYSPPWPRPDGSCGDPYGKARCWTDDESGELAEIEAFAVRLGYQPHHPGRLAPARTPAIA